MDQLEVCLDCATFSANLFMAKCLELDKAHTKCSRTIMETLEEIVEQQKNGKLSKDQAAEVHKICNSILLCYVFKDGSTELRYTAEETGVRNSLKVRDGVDDASENDSLKSQVDSDATDPCFDSTMDDKTDWFLAEEE